MLSLKEVKGLEDLQEILKKAVCVILQILNHLLIISTHCGSVISSVCKVFLSSLTYRVQLLYKFANARPPCCVFTGVTWRSTKVYHVADGTLQGEGKQNCWQVMNTLSIKRIPTCAGRFSARCLIPPAAGFETSTWAFAFLNPWLPQWLRLVRTELTRSLILHYCS